MNFFNDRTKKINWWNRNYLFIGTFIIIAVILCLYGTGVDRHIGNPEDYDWYGFANLSNFFQNFVNCFFHLDWPHVIFNSVSIFICGLYTERKIGSIPMLLLTLLLAIFASAFIGSNNLSTNWVGLSSVIYAFYGFIFIEYLFSLKKERRSKFNIIFGIVILALIWFLMCLNTTTGTWFSVGPYNVGMSWIPHELLYNGAHYTGFLAGVITCFLFEINKFL